MNKKKAIILVTICAILLTAIILALTISLSKARKENKEMTISKYFYVSLSLLP